MFLVKAVLDVIKVMKRLGFIALFIFSAICLNAQSLADCENVIKKTVNAINSYSSEAVQPYLSADFECSGQKGDVANLVLNATIEKLKQSNDSIMKYERTSENWDGNTLTLAYSFTMSCWIVICRLNYLPNSQRRRLSE